MDALEEKVVHSVKRAEARVDSVVETNGSEEKDKNGLFHASVRKKVRAEKENTPHGQVTVATANLSNVKKREYESKRQEYFSKERQKQKEVAKRLQPDTKGFNLALELGVGDYVEKPGSDDPLYISVTKEELDELNKQAKIRRNESATQKETREFIQRVVREDPVGAVEDLKNREMTLIRMGQLQGDVSRQDEIATLYSKRRELEESLKKQQQQVEIEEVGEDEDRNIHITFGSKEYDAILKLRAHRYDPDRGIESAYFGDQINGDYYLSKREHAELRTFMQHKGEVAKKSEISMAEKATQRVGETISKFRVEGQFTHATFFDGKAVQGNVYFDPDTFKFDLSKPHYVLYQTHSGGVKINNVNRLSPRMQKLAEDPGFLQTHVGVMTRTMGGKLGVEKLSDDEYQQFMHDLRNGEDIDIHRLDEKQPFTQKEAGSYYIEPEKMDLSSVQRKIALSGRLDIGDARKFIQSVY